MVLNNRKKLVQILGMACASLIVITATADVQAARKEPLKPKRIATFLQLKRMLSAKTVQRNQYVMFDSLATANAGAVFAPTKDLGEADHSETNVQVAGVDEGDVVKTDGRFIYRIQNSQVRIVRAYPATNMDVVSTLQFDTGFYPIELYVQGNQLVVIGTGWHADNVDNKVPVLQAKKQAKMAIWAPSGESRTMARVYDISNRTNPVMEREIAFSGDYLSSRKIGESVYLLGRKYPNYYFMSFGGIVADPAFAPVNFGMTRNNILPKVSDSVVNNGQEQPLPLADIYYFPNFVEPDYVIVAGFRLNALSEEADVKAYLGSGDIAYASTSNLYLSAADYKVNTELEQSVSAPVTHIYKFALNDGVVTFNNAGEVPGTALNSFSMDEHDGYFRIATTVDQWTQSGDFGSIQTWNNMYTLDNGMNVVGRLEHLAEGERIYSARFMGDRSYLVTFQQTDPLFAIDLSVPADPKVLGELKIPGFSNYLHPYDQNHILGFGQDTEQTETGAVVTKGMKLALFDVSDVAHPTQMHSLTIGKQGTYSPLMWDHKALLFDKKRGLLGFPISISAKKPGDEWASEVFQGAQVYKISLEDGFQKQASISHQENHQYYDWNHYVQRLLTIGNQLYTLSETRIQANDMVNYDLTGVLDFPIEQPPFGCALASTDGTVATDLAIDCPILIDPIITETIAN